MSTRSNVAVVDPITNQINVIYVHSDGYPDGVGNCLTKYYYSYDKAKELIAHGNASFLGSTIEECSFYERQDEKNLSYNNEYWYMDSMRADHMIEYIYLFRNNQWFVSSSKAIKKPKNAYEGYIAYWTKFIPVEQHEEYTGPDKLKHGETEMISKMHGMLQKAFKSDKVVSALAKKQNKLN